MSNKIKIYIKDTIIGKEVFYVHHKLFELFKDM
jgi:hypothetical protein